MENTQIHEDKLGNSGIPMKVGVMEYIGVQHHIRLGKIAQTGEKSKGTKEIKAKGQTLHFPNFRELRGGKREERESADIQF